MQGGQSVGALLAGRAVPLTAMEWYLRKRWTTARARLRQQAK